MKKQRKNRVKKPRGSWNGVNPVTKVVPMKDCSEIRRKMMRHEADELGRKKGL